MSKVELPPIKNIYDKKIRVILLLLAYSQKLDGEDG